MKLLSKKDKNDICNQFLLNVGNVIKRHRENKNISQSDLAVALDIDRSTLSKYETGKGDMNISLMPLISVYCDFPLKEYVAFDKSDLMYNKFRKLVKIEANKYKRKQSKAASNKTLQGRIYMVGGKEVFEPATKTKVSRKEKLLSCQEDYPVEPMSIIEFEAYMNEKNGGKYKSIMNSCVDMIAYYEEKVGKETIKGEIADAVIDEVVIAPILIEKVKVDDIHKRMYMLYRKLFLLEMNNNNNDDKN